MKNRSYNRKNRSIKQKSANQWVCTAIAPQGALLITPVIVNSRETAFAWLDREVSLRFENPGMSKSERKRRKDKPQSKQIKLYLQRCQEFFSPHKHKHQV